MALSDILNAAQIGHDPLRARMQGRFSNGKNEIAIPLIGSHLRGPRVLLLLPSTAHQLTSYTQLRVKS